jgi:hypothetical protein
VIKREFLYPFDRRSAESGNSMDGRLSAGENVLTEVTLSKFSCSGISPMAIPGVGSFIIAVFAGGQTSGWIGIRSVDRNQESSDGNDLAPISGDQIGYIAKKAW